MRRNTNRVWHWIAFLSAFALIGPAHTEPASTENTYGEAWALYAGGSVSQAISKLEKSLPSPDKAAQEPKHLGAVAQLIEICTRAADWDCVVKWATTAVALTLKNPRVDTDFLRTLAHRQASYYVALLGAIQDTPDAAREALDKALELDTDAPYDSEKYIDRQILAANLYFKLDDRVGARIAVERALATLLSVVDASNYRWFIATRLVACLSMLATLGDVERAFGHYLISGNFLAQSFPDTSIDYVAFRLMEANLLQQTGNLPGALNAAKQARESMNSIEVRKNPLYQWEYTIDLELAFIAILANDYAVADSALQRLEKSINTRGLASRKAPLGPGEISVLALRALQRVATQQPLDERLATRLSQPSDPNLSPGVLRQFEIYRKFGLLASQLSQQPGTYMAAREVAKDYLSFVRDRARFSFEIFPRPSSLDRLIATSLLGLISSSPVTESGDADLLFQLADVSTRSARSFDSEALAILGMSRTQEERQLLHQGLRLASRRTRHEQEELRRLIHSSGIQEQAKGFLEIEYGRRVVLGDFFERIERTREYFAVTNPSVNVRALLPNTGELQASLRSDEAVLKVLPVATNELLALCVTSTAAVVRRSSADITTADNDARILTLSLTASHAADDQLDAQYPAESANRLYLTLFGPTEDCTGQKRLVFWLMSQTAMPVPVAALLRSVPQRIGNGYDLASADWLVKSTAIAMLETPDTLVALRSNRQLRSQATLRLLGVGDPVLAGLTASGQTRSSAVLRGSIATAKGAIAALSPLPDSREELRTAMTAVGPPSTLLVGEDATEAVFRRQPLSQYRYVSFATHGLIREEIPGLREAALVLTPGSTDDTFDDGLLTASELADLPLAADFAALSACNTASFDLAEFSADVPGLATSLAISGVPATLATLWPVDSMTSGRVVADVFAQLGATPDTHPAQALAAAQRRFLNDLPRKAYAHPRFWAPFILLGDSNYGSRGDEEDPNQRLAVQNIRFVTTNGGEVLAAAADRNGAVTASATAEWNGQSFARSVISLLPNGAPDWKRNRYDIGAGSVAIPAVHGSILGAYTKPVAPSYEISALVELIDGNGSTVSQAKISQPGMTIYPTAATALPDQSNVVVFSTSRASTPSPQDEDSNSRSLLVKRYSATLELLSEVQLPFTKGATFARPAVTSDPQRIYIVAADPTYARKLTEYVDILQNPRVCMPRPQTWLYVLDRSTMATERTVWVADSFVSGFFTGVDGTVFAVGSETHCDGGTQLVLWKVTAEGLQSVYREDSIISTHGRHGLALSDGGILLVGTSRRVTDISRHEERRADSDEYADFRPKVSYSEKETDDLLMLLLSPSGNMISRTVTPFGGSVYIHGLLRANWGPSAFGSVAGQGAFIDLQVN